jgi:hypothetical protein
MVPKKVYCVTKECKLIKNLKPTTNKLFSYTSEKKQLPKAGTQ